MIKPYKIAIVDQDGNPGGGARFTNKIIENFPKESKNLKIDFFGNEDLIKKYINKKNFSNINFYYLKSLLLNKKGIFKIKQSKKIVSILQKKLKKYSSVLPSYISGNLKKEMEKRLNNYDVVLFLWPYFLECPNIKGRKIIVLHDLNFKYYFSGQSTFNLSRINLLNETLKKWISVSDVILTSNFMKKEFLKFYPKFKNNLKVIRMGSFADPNNLKKLKRKNIFNFPYILCPSSTHGHKNISTLIKAFSIIKKHNNKIRLIFTGPGTEVVNGNNFENFLEICNKNNSIIGLGYIKNEEINYLIKNALIVINCSLYEPGNGSGLDAWKLGSLVAMSNISSFKEHINYLDVKAELFDPINPSDIAKKINKLISMDKFKRKKYINYSKSKIKKVEWNLVIKEYIKFINY